MNEPILMNVPSTVISVEKPSVDKTTYVIIDTFTRKKNHSNVTNVEKVFVSHGHWPFIGFYIWKSHLIDAQFVSDALTRGPTSKPIY